ncbi:ADP-ribosylglycohydrolase family protein [Nitrosospira multiformis]|uniref:ADP-ribosylglycohydrolase family protein n=1 Tax=Nitrosospira multiformis TaxID=1231 RepID=UPI002159070A|nr:ADP-ribosylglycohydrolase family protein [Nitrosospira multiformis]
MYHQLPAAYYLAARFPRDFESAVLHAVNGGGQNQARAHFDRGSRRSPSYGLGIPARHAAQYACNSGYAVSGMSAWRLQSASGKPA